VAQGRVDRFHALRECDRPGTPLDSHRAAASCGSSKRILRVISGTDKLARGNPIEERRRLHASFAPSCAPSANSIGACGGRENSLLSSNEVTDP
jgi:hypothetical protein